MRTVIKRVAGYFLYLFYCILNLIFLKKKKRIVFVSFPEASDNSWYLYKYALENIKNYEIVWLVENNSKKLKEKIFSCDGVFKNGNRVVIAKRRSVRGLILFSNSKFVFFTHGCYFFARAAFNSPTIVNLWHGMPIKAICFLEGKSKNDVCYSDYLIATSDFYSKVMSDAFNLPLDRVLSTGLPRNDVLYKGVSSKKRSEIFNSLSINTGSTIIVWLPTYRVSAFGDVRSDAINKSFLDDLEYCFLEDLNSICSVKKVVVVVKLHPMDSVTSGLQGLRFSNILFYDPLSWLDLNIELYDLLSLSKGVISDFSSVMIDCLSTNISVGFISSSQVNYSRKVVVPVDKLLESVFLINSPSDVLNMISDDNSEFKSKCRGTFFNSYGGEASSKLFDLLSIR